MKPVGCPGRGTGTATFVDITFWSQSGRSASCMMCTEAVATAQHGDSSQALSYASVIIS